MARTPDLERRQELLDRIVLYLAEHGLAQATLRPMASALDVSINRLVHHFGSKDELITTALTRAIDQQIEVQQKWLQRQPDLTMVQLYSRWWRWMTASRANLSLVRLNYEAAALDTSVTGLAGDVRADQIGVWRHDVEKRLLNEGMAPPRAAVEASLMKATFSGLIMDLLATGDKRRLTPLVDEWLRRVADRPVQAAAGT
ncbi:MAG: transcriptional regulator, TetR family [Ilumatobacteraceae bacterium]|nr:transcriptional regulator, TetR family [Ilumatobacteraceae bacterium]